MAEKTKITSLQVPQLAQLLSSISGRQITTDQVRKIAENAGIIKPDGTVSLLEYAAFLVREISSGD